MASNDSELKISISADAQPAVTALTTVGEQSKKTKKQLDSLKKSVTDTNKQFKTLVSTLGNIENRKPGDVFGLKQAATDLGNFKTEILGMRTTLKKTSSEFAKDIRTSYRDLKKAADLFRKPREAFKVTTSTLTALKSFDGLLKKFKADRAGRQLMVQTELRAAQQRLQMERLITKEYSNRVQLSKRSLTKQRQALQAAQNTTKTTRRRREEAVSALTTIAPRMLSSAATERLYRRMNGGDAFGSRWAKVSPWQLPPALALREVRRQRRRPEGTLRRRRASEPETVARNSLRARDDYSARDLAHMGMSYMAADYGMSLLRGGFDHIKRLQQVRARVDAWGLSPKDRAMFEYQTRELQKNNPLMSLSDSYSMMMAAASSIGHYDPKIVGQTVQAVTKYAQMEKALGYNASNIDDIAKNYYGVAEARQVTSDPRKVLDTFRTIFRITTTTAGKITVGDVETILRNMGQGAATISDEGLLRLLAYAEQIKVAGRGSSGSAGAGISTVGNTVKMLQLMAMGKPSSIHAKKMIGELGLLEDSAYITAKSGELQLNFNAQKDKKDSDVAQLAQVMLTRGAYGQTTDRVALGKLSTFASAGFFNKRMAQEDPVKFVEDMIPLIEAYTAQAEHRRDYYDSKTLQGKENLSAEEFLKTLNMADITSAMTTFWAKTGLSQRVVNALTTFSNRAFIERSTAMKHTAEGQLNADEIYKQQIEEGNLTLASQRVEKAIENLAQAFEPASKVIAKMAMYVADLIDKITNWVSEYQTLAQMTGGWLILKTLSAVLETTMHAYSLLNREQTRAIRTTQQETAALQANTAAKALNAQASGSSIASTAKTVAGLSGGTQATANALSSVQSRSVTVFGGLSRSYSAFMGTVQRGLSFLVTGVSRALSGIGIALLAIDFASIVWDWVKDAKVGAKTIEEIFSDMADRISALNPFAGWQYKREDLRTPEQNDELTRRIKRRDEVGARLDALRAERESLQTTSNVSIWDTFSDAFKGTTRAKDDAASRASRLQAIDEEIAKLDQEFQNLDGLIRQTQNLPSELGKKNDEALKNLKQILDKNGVTELLAKIGVAEKERDETENAAVVIGQSQASIETKKEADQRAVEAQKAFEDLTADLLEGEFKSEDVKSAIGGIDSIFSQAESTELKKLLARSILEVFDGIAKEAGKGEGFFSNAIKPETLARISQPAAYLYTTFASGLGTSAMSTEKGTQIATELSQLEDPKKFALAQKAEALRFDRLNALISDNKAAMSQAGRPVALDAYGNETYDLGEAMRTARENFLADLVAGKYRRKAKNGMAPSPFLKSGVTADDESKGAITDKDFDLNIKDELTGFTGEQIVQQIALVNIAQRFKNELERSTSQIASALKESGYTLEDAKANLDDFNAEYTPSETMRKFDREDAERESRYRQAKATGVLTPAMERMYQAQQAQNAKVRFQTSMSSGYDMARQLKDQAREQSMGSMTVGQQLGFNYERDNRILKAEYERQRREIEMSAERLKNYTTNAEEIKQIEQQKNETLLNLQTQYQNASLQSQKSYLRERYGDTEGHINQTIEDWQNTGSQMDQLSDQIMEGFVTANEKWLDGDKESWREYFNDILMMWRNIALKQGYSELLGGLTKGTTNQIGGFVNGVFGRSQGEGQPNQNNTGGYSFGSAIWNSINPNSTGPGVTDWFKSLFSDSPATASAPTVPANAVNQSTSIMTAGQTPANSFMGGLMSAGTRVGTSAVTSMMNMGKTTSGLLGGGCCPCCAGAGGGLMGGSGGSGGGIFGNTGLVDSNGNLNTGDLFGNLEDSSNALSLSTDSLTQGFTNLGDSGNLLNTAQTSLTQATGESGGILDLFTGWISDAAEAVMSFITSLMSQEAADKASSVASAFAKGGIMTSHGPLPLNTYASGGIAKKAQVAVFGEGRQPEAYVPLPDGKTIPVTVNGGAGAEGQQANMGGNNVVITINVTNNADGSSEEGQSESGNDASNMKQLANNLRSLVKQEIATQSRPGGLLYNGR